MTVHDTVEIETGIGYGQYADLTTVLPLSVQKLEWRIGLTDVDAAIAAPGRAQISCALIAPVDAAVWATLPGRHIRLRVQQGDASTLCFGGRLTRIEPDTSGQPTRRVVLHAVDVVAALRGLPADSSIRPLAGAMAGAMDSETALTAVRSDQAIRHLLTQLPLYETLQADTIVLDQPQGRLGHRLYGDGVAMQLASGRTDFVPSAAGTATVDEADALAVLGRFASDEAGLLCGDASGTLHFLSRHDLLRATTPHLTCDSIGRAWHYRQLVPLSDVTVTLRPTTLGPAHSVLWQLDAPQRILPGRSTMVTASFTHEGEPATALRIDPIDRGHLQAHRADDTAVDATRSLQVRIVAQQGSRATLQLSHDQRRPIVLTRLLITGQPLVELAPLSVEVNSLANRLRSGTRRQRIDLTYVGDIITAMLHARHIWQIGQYEQPVVERYQPDLITQPAARLVGIGDTVRLIDQHTTHDRLYRVVGIESQVQPGIARQQVEWLLRPADALPFFVLGHSLLDGSRPLLY